MLPDSEANGWATFEPGTYIICVFRKIIFATLNVIIIYRRSDMASQMWPSPSYDMHSAAMVANSSRLLLVLHAIQRNFFPDFVFNLPTSIIYVWDDDDGANTGSSD